MKVIHGFIPDGHLCAGYIIACCPTMGFALNKNLFLITAEVKSMRLFLATFDANIYLVI